ncbi:uncharacterized protein LOC125178709 [Hyalella azteca]|uniref:Uncharacterized protein LOC125178709 n=1 Tax=Hyalella azteca TaxID=294128 RepID=A0A979FPN9_HYAAZ|nr:uncharacterized protein LOC125178709 [Hyalella azteca]
MVELSRSLVYLGCLLVSSTLQIQTVRAAKDVVSQLKLYPQKTMIDATWELQEPTGEVIRYLVSWIPDGVGVATASCYVNSSATSTSACDVYPTLDSCTLYTVTVQPKALGGSTQINTGTPASAAAYTLQDVPPAGSPPEVSSVASRSVTLTWTKPATKCEVVNYTVVYSGQVMWGNHATLEVNSAYSKTTTINIAGLTPYSNYSFSVVAATAAGKGEPSLPTYCVTQEDDDNFRKNLNNDSTSTSSFPPSEPNIGLIVGMLVGISLFLMVLGLLIYFRRQIGASCCKEAPAKHIESPSNKIERDTAGNIPLADQRYTQMSSDAGSQYEIPLLTPPPQLKICFMYILY